MEKDFRERITEYFSYSDEERKQLITELSQFYFEKNVSTKNIDEFELTIDQLIFFLEMEWKFSIKSESYNRAEIYSKLSKIFYNIKESTLNQTEDGL
jgi:hypothetical protein